MLGASTFWTSPEVDMSPSGQSVGHESEARGSQRLALLWSAALGSLLGVAWVLLTWKTGLTYHFFPLAIVLAILMLPALVFGLRLDHPMAALVAVARLLVVAISWVVMGAGDFTPSATFVEDQPGGVLGEVIVFSLGGTAGGLWFATRRR